MPDIGVDSGESPQSFKIQTQKFFKRVFNRTPDNRGAGAAEQRYKTARDNTERLIKVLQCGDIQEFIEIAEAEALQLHEMMATSNPPYKLMEPNTLKIIDLVREYRRETNVPVCFTLDAGPNVHLLYPDDSDAQVKQFIKESILQYCNDYQYIDDVVQNEVKL